jgi:dTDP-4-amino-4,6-dideoxygalactose transaminase
MIPLAVPNLCGHEGRYLQECIDSTFVSSVGPFVERFETMTAEACGARHAIAVSSGTSALHLALMSAGVAAGDLVIAPSFTFIATANAIAHCGAVPWLFDVETAGWTLDAAQVARSLSAEAQLHDGKLVHRGSGRRIAALLPVYTLGNPPDMEGLREIARQHRLPIVADGAAALGTTYRDSPIGGLADATMISFNGNKTVTAGGGGMVVTDDEALARLARHISTTARVGSEYEHDRVGYNYRMTNLQAAVGCAQMEQLARFVSRKREIDMRYRETLGTRPGCGSFARPTWGQSACWFSGVVLPAGRDTRAFCGELRERGIEARTFWKPVHLQQPFLEAPRAAMANTEALWKRIATLPCSTGLSVQDQERVIAAVRSTLA